MRAEAMADMVRHINQMLAGAPKGSLIESQSHGCTQYRQYLNGKYIYLSVSDDADKITALAQKSYEQQIRRAASDELKAIEAYLRLMPEKTVEEIYGSLSPERQKLVTPYTANQDFINQWYQRHRPWTQNSYPIQGNYVLNGVHFRSRAEWILANLLEKQNSPWVYETPLQVTKDGYTETLFPDFTVLNVRTMQTLYIEYFGRLSSPSYLEKAYQKVKLYEENRIYPGKELILLGETEKSPLDTVHMERVLRAYLL